VGRPHAPRTRVSTYLSEWMPTGDTTRQSVAGYIAGGGSTTSNSETNGGLIDKITFSSDTRSTLSAVMSNYGAVWPQGFANSGVAGYISGGYSGASSTPPQIYNTFFSRVDKILFPTDAKSTLTATVLAKYNSGSCANSGVAGYIASGDEALSTSTAIQKLVFSTEIVSTLSATTTAGGRWMGMVSNNGIAGYIFLGGYGSNAIDKLLFSTDTKSSLVATKSGTGAGFFANGSVAGYICGGDSANYALIDKLSFSAETISASSAVLDIASQYNSGSFANHEVAGYVNGGNNMSGGSPTNRSEKFAFPSDTRSLLGTILTAAVSAGAGFADCGVF
jgi:hypothetical protein